MELLGATWVVQAMELLGYLTEELGALADFDVSPCSAV